MTIKEFRNLNEADAEEFARPIREKVREELSKMTPQEISDKFDSMINAKEYGFKGEDDAEKLITYNEYWLARAKDDPQGEWSEKDQIKFPRFGHASGEWVEPVGLVGKALNKIKGVRSSNGTIYNGTCVHNGRMIWFVKFDSIATYQHFIWAGCWRYFPLSKNDDWLLTVDDGDPDYRKTDEIQMQLQYQDLEATREKWENDLRKFAAGLERYASKEEEIAKKLAE